MASFTRRQAVKHAVALTGGIAASTPLLARVGEAAAAPAAGRTEQFALDAVGVRATGARRPSAGDQQALRGDLVDGSGPAGTFTATSTILEAGGAFADPDGVATIEHQVFHLAGGTLVGQGGTTHGGSGTFAVTGGTGAYHGASGSYTQQRQLAGPGGTATFSFTLLLPEAP